MSKERDNIVFLDAGTVNYGDLSFDGLHTLGNFKPYHHTVPNEIEMRVRNADIVITNKCRFDAALIKVLRQVKSIHVTATGYNNIDIEAARERRIALTNVSGYSTETVVQFTFSFILALAGNLLKYDQAVHHGAWSASPFFVLGVYPIQEIARKKLGIIGFGAIGRRVAEVAKVFKMDVLIAKIPGKKYPAKDKIKRYPLDKILAQSDFVSIHAPLTDLTRNLIGKDLLLKMKKSAFLINMARGGIVNEEALRAALDAGVIAGAACDVLTQEPPAANHVLLGAPNLILTPHIAWASLEARRRVVSEVALNIQAFQKGKKRNRIV